MTHKIKKGPLITIVMILAIAGIITSYHVWLRQEEVKGTAQFRYAPNPLQRNLPRRDHQKVIRILSISGGGIFGILPATILDYLEQQTGRPTSQMFDFIVGTSTGSIAAVVLTLPGKDGKPKYSAHQLLELYKTRSSDVFYSPWYNTILTLDGVIGPKYLNGPRIRLVNELCDHLYFDDLLTNVIIPVYGLYEGAPLLFYNWRIPGLNDENFHIAPLLLGAISPPSIFPAIVFGTKKAYALVDGGIFANNPSILGLMMAMAFYPNKEYVLVSLGTGELTPYVNPNQEVSWGLLQWGAKLIPTIIDGTSRFQNLTLQHILKVLPGFKKYYYFNIDVKNHDFDNSSPANIEKINTDARRLILKNKSQLDALVKDLKKFDTEYPD